MPRLYFLAVLKFVRIPPRGRARLPMLIAILHAIDLEQRSIFEETVFVHGLEDHEHACMTHYSIYCQQAGSSLAADRGSHSLRVAAWPWTLVRRCTERSAGESTRLPPDGQRARPAAEMDHCSMRGGCSFPFYLLCFSCLSMFHR